MACPQGFEKTLDGNCRMTCPNDFKFMQEPPSEKCVHKMENGIEVALNIIPPTALVATFNTERDRFNAEIEKKKKYYDELQTQRNELNILKDQSKLRGARVESIEKEYTEFKSVQGLGEKVREITDSIKRPRGMETEIEKERKAIALLSEQNLLLVQVVLGLLITSLLAYIFLPVNAAHGLTFLLLCVGIAVGIFLKK